MGLSDRIVDMITAAQRTSTQKQYLCHIKKWTKYCLDNNLDHREMDVPAVLEFLTSLHYEGLSHSTVNSARSALSSYFWEGTERQAVGSHPLVVKLLRGIFNTNPPRARYSQIWYVSVVLTMLRNWSPATALTLNKLTMNMVILMALVTA